MLFIAALLSILAFSGLYVVGSNHNISIENGFVTFAKDTIKIVFFGEEKEECITIDALLTDLELHGYGDILFPLEFVTKSDEYKVSLPEYSDSEFKQIGFSIYNEVVSYNFIVHKYNQNQKTRDFDNITIAESIEINDTVVYLFEFDTGTSAFEFTYGKVHYFVYSSTPYSDIVKIAKTLK